MIRTNQNRGLCVTPGGRRAAVVQGSRINVWDAETGGVGRVLTGHRSGPILALHPDGATLASASSDRVCLWDLATGERRVSVGGVRNTIQSLAFAPDGSSLAGGGDDQVVRVWGLDGVERQQFLGHRGSVHALDFAADGRTLASGGTDGTVRLWQPASGDELLALEGLGGAVCYAAFSSDGRHLVCGERDERDPERLLIRRYDCGRPLGRPPRWR
jgi:WD40 repeat protein